jgi:hypothetical protein
LNHSEHRLGLPTSSLERIQICSVITTHPRDPNEHRLESRDHRRCFFAAIWIASFALELFMGRSYPAWTVIAALVIVSPIVVLLWRDRFS